MWSGPGRGFGRSDDACPVDSLSASIGCMGRRRCSVTGDLWDRMVDAFHGPEAFAGPS